MAACFLVPFRPVFRQDSFRTASYRSFEAVGSRVVALASTSRAPRTAALCAEGTTAGTAVARVRISQRWVRRVLVMPWTSRRSEGFPRQSVKVFDISNLPARVIDAIPFGSMASIDDERESLINAPNMNSSVSSLNAEVNDVS